MANKACSKDAKIGALEVLNNYIKNQVEDIRKHEQIVSQILLNTIIAISHVAAGSDDVNEWGQVKDDSFEDRDNCT